MELITLRPVFYKKNFNVLNFDRYFDKCAHLIGVLFSRYATRMDRCSAK